MNILKYNTTFKPGKPVDLELEAGQSRNFGAGAVQSLRPEPTLFALSLARDLGLDPALF
jgi:hypothetical protein